MSRRLIAAATVIAVIVILAWLALGMWREARTAKTQSRVDRGQAEAATQAGAEAVSTVGANADKAAVTDRAAKEGTDAINQAQGGDSNDAADRAACRMRAYRDSERCRQLLGPRPADMGAGRATH